MTTQYAELVRDGDPAGNWNLLTTSLDPKRNFCTPLDTIRGATPLSALTYVLKEFRWRYASGPYMEHGNIMPRYMLIREVSP